MAWILTTRENKIYHMETCKCDYCGKFISHERANYCVSEGYTDEYEGRVYKCCKCEHR